MKTYEQWREEQLRFVRGDLPRTIDDVESLADDVARNGSEIDSPAEQLAYAVDGLVAEIRERRAADSYAVVADANGLPHRVFLSGAEVEALQWTRGQIELHRMRTRGSADWRTMGTRALAALDKLIGGGK